MFKNKYKVVGVLGGMGPAATRDFYDAVIAETPAQKDQDHIPMLIFSNPKIPDRTASYFSNDSGSVVSYLQETAQIIEKGGADFIVMPCNTAHIYYHDIQTSVTIPVIDMIEETANYVQKNFPEMKSIGLLGTTGTIKSEIYQKKFKEKNIDLIQTSEESQKNYVMEAIYRVKAGKDLPASKEFLLKAIDEFKTMGCKGVIFGCTEIPVVIKSNGEQVSYINPTQILAKTTVSMALNS